MHLNHDNVRMHQQIKSPDEILHLFETKAADDDWSFAECRRSDTGKWTHNYHRYPAKFIPQLVERLIDEYVSNKDAHINDPFYGCGTTIVTAVSRGPRASGTDINKAAHLITKVKSTPIEPGYLARKVNEFLSRASHVGVAERTLFDSSIEPLIPDRHVDRINYWFTEHGKTELGKILKVICQEDDRSIRGLLLVAFSHILKSCSVWLQRSTKPTRDRRKHPTRPYDAMRKHLKSMQRGNEAFYEVVPAHVRDSPDKYLNLEAGDARSQPVPDGSVDLIVTSSPYVTSYEYADLHQLSTIWLDLTEDLTEYKKEFIGTSLKEYENKSPRSELARHIVTEMCQRSLRVAKEIEAFFVDMEEVFDESSRILRPGRRCCYVIGDTSGSRHTQRTGLC